MGDAYLAPIKLDLLMDDSQDTCDPTPPISWTTALSRRVKHTVLDYAHPMPETMYVYAGAPGSLERSIVRGVLAVAPIPGLVESGPGEGENERVPMVWVGEDGVGMPGCLAACRYLGRLWRLYPTEPTAALCVDTALDQLSDVLEMDEQDSDDVKEVFKVHLQLLQDRLGRYPNAQHLEELDAPSLADVCWVAALRWILYKLDKTELLDADQEFPNVAAWWEVNQ